MKVSFIFNNTTWASIPDKIQNVINFYAPDFTIVPTVIHTNFIQIPLVKVLATNGIANTIGTNMTVDPNWYNVHVTPLSPDAEIIVFFVDTPNCASLCPTGIEQGKINGVVQTCIFGHAVYENWRNYLYENGQEVDLGDAFTVIAEHEISHALYLLENKRDNTHLYFYTGQASKVLLELRTNMQFSPMIIKWAESIAHWEGANSTLNNPGNMGYTTLTASWGATKGPAKSDGGFLSQFPTYQIGFNALCNFLKLGCENELLAFHSPEARTFAGFTKIYAGNPPEGYIQGIANELGCQLDTQINTFL